MMLIAVHAIDDAAAQRQPYYDAHKAHLARAADYGVKLVIGGPLLGDDSQTAIGSLMIFEAADKASVVRFNADDPFRKSGVWRSVHVAQFDRRT